jgi:hypothetical protein
LNSSTKASVRSDQPIWFAGAELGDQRHICAFFNSPEEEYRVLLPFIVEGFERGDKAFHVVSPDLREQHIARLAKAGIDVEQAEKAGQLKLCNWNEAYLPDGRFNQNRMLAMWEDELYAALDKGFPLTRLVAHMEWSLEDRQGVSDLVEYEARFNLLPKTHDAVICTYDITRYSGDLIVDVMRTHPMVILGGVMWENPFYVPPEELLRELRSRPD